MTLAGATAVVEGAGSAVEWLEAHSRGPIATGDVILHAPSFAFQAPGGGEIQLIQSGRHLEELGIPVRLFCAWTDRLEKARLLHLFGMSREGLELARVARARGIPVVLSPICWYEPRAMAALEPEAIRKIASVLGWGLRSVLPGTPSWRSKLFKLADVVLPNSRREANQLMRLFGVSAKRIRVVPNGVLPAMGTARPEEFQRRIGTFPFVLSVGRIEPRKNTLGLIEAARRLDLALVVAGEAPPGFDRYEAVCRRAAGEKTIWLGRLEQDDPLLASAYAAARVFALPSWFETPGLAALEAALGGCAVVITPYGATREYFGEFVEYARPGRPGEIERALETCWEDGAHPGLAKWVESRYLWPRVARMIAEVYGAVGR
jgi:glycosyltransferase involved in cell wall biosynthesis